MIPGTRTRHGVRTAVPVYVHSSMYSYHIYTQMYIINMIWLPQHGILSVPLYRSTDKHVTYWYNTGNTAVRPYRW